jgi:hypothetical protein
MFSLGYELDADTDSHYDSTGNGPIEYERFRAECPSVHFVRCLFGEQVSAPSGGFDCIYSISVLDHVPTKAPNGWSIHAIDHVMALEVRPGGGCFGPFGKALAPQASFFLVGERAFPGLVAPERPAVDLQRSFVGSSGREALYEALAFCSRLDIASEIGMPVSPSSCACSILGAVGDVCTE